MTIKTFKELLKKHNIPDTATMLSDSGWECNATNMDGIYYDRKENVIIFTQNSKYDYDIDEDCEFIYGDADKHKDNLELYHRIHPGCIIKEK